MKLLVPLTIPVTRSTWAPASDSCSTRMIGTTPPTAASKRSWTPLARAQSHSSSPWRASSCLLAVTTCLPAWIARRTYSRAGSSPPMTSTIRSELWRISSNEPRERVSTPLSCGRRPVTCSTPSARSSSSRANADPTVPWPSRPTSNVSGNQVLVGLAADDEARVAVLGEDDRRPRHAVVVVGERVAVGAGGRRDDHVAGARVVEDDLVDDHIGGLAVLAGQATRRTAAEAIDDLRLVPRAVEHRPQVVRHAAIDGDPRRDVALDRLNRVERDRRVRGQGAAGLVEDRLAVAEDVAHRVDLRGDVVLQRRHDLVGVGRAQPAAEVVDLEVAEAGDRLDRGAERVELEQLRPDVHVQAGQAVADALDGDAGVGD